MRRWTEIAERVAATTKTSEKTAILAEYLAGLTPAELPIAAVFLTGRPFPEADQRSIGVGWSGLGSSVLRVAAADPEAMRRAYDRSSDVATAVGEVLAEAGHAPDPANEPTLPEVEAAFEAIEAASGRGRQGGGPRRAHRPVVAADGDRHRQGPQRRAPDRAPRGPARGRHREGLRPAARRGQAGRDADR